MLLHFTCKFYHVISVMPCMHAICLPWESSYIRFVGETDSHILYVLRNLLFSDVKISNYMIKLYRKNIHLNISVKFRTISW